MLLLKQSMIHGLTNNCLTLKVDCVEDSGNSLWAVFNRVQEKLINGDCSYTMGAKVRKARAVKNFNQDLKINEALWSLAEEFVH